MRKTSMQDTRIELPVDPTDLVDPVYIATTSPAGYFLHDVEGQLMFCHGWQCAEVWEREAAEELIYRNQIRNSFLVSTIEAC